MKRFLSVITLAGGLAACAQPVTLSSKVPVAAVQNVQTALATYQAALGVAQVALQNNPGGLARLNTLTAQAAPYVAAVQQGATTAETAPTLGALAAELLVEFAPYVHVVPNA